MEIKLKLDPNLTKEQLLEKLPVLMKAVAETVLEKGAGIKKDIEEGIWKYHPVKPIAEAENALYQDGHEAITGLYSWLVRSLKISTEFVKSLTPENFRDSILENHGVALGDSVSFEHAKALDAILDKLPREFVDDKIKKISTDARFGSSKRKYPNHGRYLPDDKKVVLNPDIFGKETSYVDGQNKPVTTLAHTLLHEIAHGIDDKYGLSDKKEWREISGWKYIGLDGEPAEGSERLLLKEDGKTMLKGRWSYKTGTTFARWYGARNPAEDFCESFVFAYLGCDKHMPDLFVGESGQKKLAFVKRIVESLNKSCDAGDGFSVADDEEILKSQDYQRYAETRMPSLLDLEESEVSEIIKSEFLNEVCEDLSLEKALDQHMVGQEPHGKPHPLKGQIKPGHKYLKREQRPDGSYRYWYEMPNGQVYHSPDELHDEGRHQPKIKSESEWGKYAAARNIGPEGATNSFPEVKRGEGVEAHHFDAPPVPHIIDDIKPNAAMFDPNAKPGDAEMAEDERQKNEVDTDWRHNKPAREQQDLSLDPDDAKTLEAALKTWEIEDVDEKFGQNGNVNVTMKVKIKNDGWGLLKPHAGSLINKDNPLRGDIDEMSTIFREALAYSIDKALKWNLVPPTVIRTMKGMGQRNVLARFRQMWGDPKHWGETEKQVYDSIEKNEKRYASLQHFAEGAHLFYNNEHNLDLVDDKEIMRATLFDMIINNQDRHSKNLMLTRETSPDRYGGEWRMVLIDHGYSFGNGSEINNRAYDNHLSSRVEGKHIDKETLRALRKLRDDISDKRRRRKIVPEEIRHNIPHDQIERIAKRIDFILGQKRDKLGRVTMPSWTDMAEWELKNHPAKHHGPVDSDDNPFDITGKTNMLGQNPERVKREAKIRDFLHPLLEHLTDEQRKYLDDAIGAADIGAKKPKIQQARLEANLGALARRLPKNLCNQLFVKQKLGHRLGLDRIGHKQLDARVKEHLNRDLVGDFHRLLKDQNLEAFNKLQRGELGRDELRRILGKDVFNRMEGRWLLPKEMREGVQKDKTAAIFDDPRRFGWSGSHKHDEGETLDNFDDRVEKSQDDGEPALIIEE